MNDEERLKLVKNDLRAVLLSKKDGISIAKLLREFEDLTCESLDFRKYGSYSLEEFLRGKCWDVCRFGYDPKNPGIARVIAVADEDTKHIAELQKRTRQAKSSPPVRRRFQPNQFMNQMQGGFPVKRMVYQTYDNRWSSSTRNGGRSSQVDRSNQWKGSSLHPSRQPRTNYQSPGNAQFGRGYVKPQAPTATAYSSNAAPRTRPIQTSANSVPKLSKPATTAVTTKKPVKAASTSSTTTSRPTAIKKPKKETKSPWNIYGMYLLSILKNKKFGAFKADLEKAYEEKFRESLPEEWVEQLEGRYVFIANNFGDDILLIKCLPQEEIDRVNAELKKELDRMDDSVVEIPAVEQCETVDDINEHIELEPCPETVEAEITSRITTLEMESLQHEERLFTSRTRYSGPGQPSQPRKLRRPIQLYQLNELSEAVLGLREGHEEQRVQQPQLNGDVPMKRKETKQNQENMRNTPPSDNGPSMADRFSRYRECADDIFWSDEDTQSEGSIGLDMESQGEPLQLEARPIFFQNSFSGGYCICERPKTLVFCSFCCYSVNDSRVKTPCATHPNKYLPCDLLVCPQCISEYIVELKETTY